MIRETDGSITFSLTFYDSLKQFVIDEALELCLKKIRDSFTSSNYWKIWKSTRHPSIRVTKVANFFEFLVRSWNIW